MGTQELVQRDQSDSSFARIPGVGHDGYEQEHLEIMSQAAGEDLWLLSQDFMTYFHSQKTPKDLKCPREKRKFLICVCTFLKPLGSVF